MLYAWHDVLGLVGVGFILLAYVLLQLEKIRSRDLSYSLMNAVGAALIVISLLYRFNLSALVMEVFWLLISIYGLVRFAATRAKEGR